MKKTAPELVAAGISPREIRKALRPREAAPPPPPPTVSPKKVRQVYEGILRGMPNEEAVRLYSADLTLVQRIRAQIDASRAKLATEAPVAWNADEAPIEGDPEYVPPPAAPVPGGGLN